MGLSPKGFRRSKQRGSSAPDFPMKTKQNSFVRASAVQIAFISLLAVLLTLGAAPARNQLERKPPDSNQAKHRSSYAYIDAHASLRQLSDRGVTFPNLCREFSGLPGVCWHQCAAIAHLGKETQSLFEPAARGFPACARF